MSRLRWEPVGCYGDDKIYGESKRHVYMVQMVAGSFEAHVIINHTTHTILKNLKLTDPYRIADQADMFLFDNINDAKDICDRYDRCSCMA